MYVLIEPQTGSELERTITALLNATGVIHRLIEDTPEAPHANGVDLIDIVATRLHALLVTMGEHRSDDELAEITCALAEVALLVADELGFSGLFDPGGPGI